MSKRDSHIDATPPTTSLPTHSQGGLQRLLLVFFFFQATTLPSSKLLIISLLFYVYPPPPPLPISYPSHQADGRERLVQRKPEPQQLFTFFKREFGVTRRKIDTGLGPNAVPVSLLALPQLQEHRTKFTDATERPHQSFSQVRLNSR